MTVNTSPLTCENCQGTGLDTIAATGQTILCHCLSESGDTIPCPMCSSPMEMDGDDEGYADFRCFACRRHVHYSPSRGWASEVGDWD